ncbi:MAG: hypothetical protein HC888_10820 [Candidatus Competibacteraceae bacterium]|nr:hypothetical protein [Candidatus Competibacteraceae bacterium]
MNEVRGIALAEGFRCCAARSAGEFRGMQPVRSGAEENAAMTWTSARAALPRPDGLHWSMLLCLLAGASLVPASASAQDKDTAITGVFFDQFGITTGVAPYREVLQFNIVDSGAGDGLPTLVRGIRFHADAAVGSIFLGTDFAWRLRIPADNPGEFVELDAAAAPANASFNVTFLSSSAFLKIPDGESATP